MTRRLLLSVSAVLILLSLALIVIGLSVGETVFWAAGLVCITAAMVLSVVSRKK